MKYLEELKSGDTFKSSESEVFILTCDFKSSGDRLCYSLVSGYPKWMSPTTVVSIEPVYTLDKDNNIIAVKVYANQN